LYTSTMVPRALLLLAFMALAATTQVKSVFWYLLFNFSCPCYGAGAAMCQPFFAIQESCIS